jgi:hypothetical protein
MSLLLVVQTFVSMADLLLDPGDLCILPFMTSARIGPSSRQSRSHAPALS